MESIIPSDINSTTLSKLIIPQRNFSIIYGFSFILVLLVIIQWIISLISNTKYSVKLSDALRKTKGIRAVPIVSGSLPYFGHGLSFYFNVIGFIQSCYKKHGPIFQIKIFRRDMIVICDRSLASEYFKTTEDKLSLYNVLERLYFSSGFSSQPKFLSNFVNIVKGSIGIKYDLFVPKIHGEAQRMIERLKDRCNSSCNQNGTAKINLTHEMMKFVCNTSSLCFIGLGLSNEVLEAVLQFTHIFNTIILATYYLPNWAINSIWGNKLKSLRMRINVYLQPEIQSYRDDPSKTDSIVIRSAVDYEEDGVGLDNEEIANLLVCLLYISTENTALGLTNSITDLVLSATPGGHVQQDKSTTDNGGFTFWESLRKGCTSYLSSNDIRGLFDYPLLNAVIMESARLNTHILSLARQPMSPAATIGSYAIGHVSTITFSPPMLMVFGPQSQDTFKESNKYNPNRFIWNNSSCNNSGKESFSAQNVMTWGAGLHLCPGKTFALYEIKMAIALLVTNFKLEIDSADLASIQVKNYFSPAAFAERKINMGIRLL